jgi:RHS repeat-associated protein
MQVMRKLTVYLASLLIGHLALMQPAKAGNGGSIVAKAVLDGGQQQIKVDSTRTVEDTAFFNPANAGILDTGYLVHNLVTLKINEATSLYLRSAFTVTVRMRLIYSNGTAIDSMDKDFTINYDSAGTYNARSSFLFNGGRRVTIKVLSITSNVSAWDVTSVLMVENQLTCSPAFIFNCSNTVSNITITPSGNPDADELPVTWTTVLGADQYDLEWTYIDSSALLNHKYGNPLDPALVFFHNATRVTITGTSYNIPLMYDSRGALFIRVRAVQCKPFNAVLPGIWSSDDSPAIMGAYGYHGHQRNLNWQSNISFAEEGKRKIMVEYFDGNFLNRQTVTKENTSNVTVVEETFYDHQGRPAIQVMPAPSLSNVVQYTAAFNTGINGTEYTQSNYDTLISPDLYCTVRADSMSILSGAAKYYSPNNPNKTSGMNQFIPDAKNYPFTETEYTQDNTGRVSRTGLVGPDHQLGTGRETKYFYGTPGQEELNALFGTEVGDKSHYFKNMVRDANGQYTITYSDMDGKVIATALAGKAPAGMAPLPSYDSVMVTETLADFNSAFIQDLSIYHQKSILVPIAGQYSFNYNLSPQSFVELNCDSADICYTCLYDLEIIITDNCNNQLLPGGVPWDTVIHNFSFANIGDSCMPYSSTLGVNFSLWLQEGSYQVTKKLTVNKDAYIFYRDSIYLPNNTCMSLEEFIEQQREIIATYNSDCIPNCDACRDSIGTYEQFRDEFILQTGTPASDTVVLRNEITTAWKNALASCEALCGDSLSDDNDIRGAMLQDMTPPYGQYADTSLAKNGDKYSIFFIPHSEEDTYVPVFKLNTLQYKDLNGNPDSVYIVESEQLVKPNTLSMSQYVQNFRSSWAEVLLPYHPEYCKLLVMESHRASNQWSRRMEAVDNFRDARSLGYLNPTGNSEFPYPIVSANVDPFAATPALKTELEKKLKIYLKRGQPPFYNDDPLTMWGMACMMARCDTENEDCIEFFTQANNVFDTTNMCDGDLDMAWRYFRQLYLMVKQDQLNKLVNNPTGCTPANPAYNSVPKYMDLWSVKHTPQFSEDLNTTVAQNGLNHLNQANGNPGLTAIAAAQAQAELDSFYARNTRAYAQQWALQLSPCAYSEEHLRDTILPRLVELCRMACDVDHPFGASTLPPNVTYTPAGTSYTFKSFQDIINAYNSAHGITNVLDCNAELITMPEPYDKQPVYSDKPIFTKPSDCECDLINDLYNQYQLSNQGDASFAAYLKRTQNITMSNGNLDLLRQMCTGNSPSGPGTVACVFLPQPIYLPASMQCNTGTVCASCVLVDSLYTEYQALYPGQTPGIVDSDDTTGIKKNTLFSNYMNNRIGFALHAVEYLQFMAACDSTEDITDTVECTDRPVSNVFLFTGTARLNDIQTASDNGYILAGATAGNGAGGDDGIIIRTNSAGSVLWTKAYGGAGDDQFTRVRHTSDNGYIAIGTTKSGRYAQGEMMIVKFSNSGVTEWTRNIGFNTIYGETGYDIVQTNDGGFAALGIYDQHTGNGEFMIARLDENGTLNWVRRFGTSRLQPDTCTPFSDSLTFNGIPAYGLIEKDDTLVIAGTGYDSNLGERYFGVIYHVDKNDGELLRNWHYTEALNPAKSIWFRDIYATEDGYRILANTAQHYTTDSMQAAVVTLSFTGDVVDYKRFNLPAGSNKISSSGMYPSNDGGYLVAQTGNSGSNIFWQRVDAEGFMQSETETTIPGNQLVGRLIQSNNNSFTAVGTNNGTKALWVDLFPSAATNCYDDTAGIGMTSPSLQRINWALEGSEFIVPTYTDTLLTSTVLNATDSSLLCEGGGNCYAVYEGPRLCGKSLPLLPPVTVDSTTTCSDSTFFAVMSGTEINKVYKDSLVGAFEKMYNQVCLNAYKYESFTVTHPKSEYHYTLFYHDQAGNLIRTIPPAGVNPNYDPEWIKDVDSVRNAGGVLTPAHTMATNYRFNTINQMVAKHTPDGGLFNYWYDRLGRLTISQNERQADSSQYNYTKYDTVGRILEVGQLQTETAMHDTISRNQTMLLDWLNDAYETAEQITKSYHDYPYTPLQPILAQKNLRNRTSWKAFYNTYGDLLNETAATATYYSYDVAGYVDTLVQDYRWGVMAANGNRFKKVVYDYDLISGKVQRVAYQPGQPDAFYHQIELDADNRVTNVKTSTDSVNWDNDAFYSYYDHGPLARKILGEQQVQGINHAYNILGWLKWINPAIHSAPGYTLQVDGSPGSVVGKSAYEILINYYANDYSAISGAVDPQAGLSAVLGNDYRSLFNGNISSIGVNINSLSHPLLYNYQHDQLNRLVKMDAWHRTGNNWSDISSIADFQERIAYDANGNILQYKRNGNNTFAAGPLAMDSLHYKYAAGKNQLNHIRDSVSNGNYTTDLDDQAAGNYSYDKIGNLVADNAEGLDKITWTIYGKIGKIEKSDGSKIQYTYDASYNRISKTVISAESSITTWYVKDANGNTLSIYTAGNDTVHNGDLAQTELNMFGVSRLGTFRRNVNVQNLEPVADTTMPLLGTGYTILFARGNKMYELTNHLGNVLVSVSDKKFGVSPNDSTVDHYIPDIITAMDYYPFGMTQPGRKLGNNYRYGFNGKEIDRDVKGGESQYDYGMRIYDPRVGRFLSLDPLQDNFPELSPYQYASNRPIDGVDVDGEEYITFHIRVSKDADGNWTFNIFKKEDFRGKTAEEMATVHNRPDYAKNFYDKYLESFGPKGRGFKFVYYDDKGEVVGKRWQMKQRKILNLTNHGYYSGPGSITKYGPGLKKGRWKELNNDFDFNYQPMGFADKISYDHDLTQELTIQQPQGWLEDVRTLASDRTLLDAAKTGLQQGTANNVREDLLRTRKIAKFFTMLIAYKEWKEQEMRRQGLDPNNIEHQSQVILSDWKPTSMKQKVYKALLKLSGGGLKRKDRGKVKPVEQKTVPKG